MTQTPARHRIVVDIIGDIAVVNFCDKKILDEQNIEAIGHQLFSLVFTDKRRNIILDFSNVEYLSSAANAKFITLNRILQEAGGSLVLCGVDPEIMEVFEITKLDKFFRICKEEQQALELANATSGQVAVLACPIPDCPGTVLHTARLPYGFWPQCPECQAVFQPGPVTGGAATSRAVTHVRAPTYKGEWMELIAGAPHVLKVGRRLDLFASEVLEKLWRAVPAPRRVLLDASEMTELSEPGLSALLNLAGEADARVAVLLPAGRRPGGKDFPPELPAFVGRGEAVAALGDLPEESRRPLTVEVRAEGAAGA